MKQQLELTFRAHFQGLGYQKIEKGDILATPIQAVLDGEITKSEDEDANIRYIDESSEYECSCKLEHSIRIEPDEHVLFFHYEDIYFFIESEEPLQPDLFYKFNCKFIFPDYIDNMMVTRLFPYNGTVPVFKVKKIMKPDEKNSKKYREIRSIESNEDIEIGYKVLLKPIDVVSYDQIKVWNPISNEVVLKALEEKISDKYPMLTVLTSNEYYNKGNHRKISHYRHIYNIEEEKVSDFIKWHYDMCNGNLLFYGKITGYIYYTEQYKYKLYNTKGDEIIVNILDL